MPTRWSGFSIALGLPGINRVLDATALILPTAVRLTSPFLGLVIGSHFDTRISLHNFARSQLLYSGEHCCGYYWGPSH